MREPIPKVIRPPKKRKRLKKRRAGNDGEWWKAMRLRVWTEEGKCWKCGKVLALAEMDCIHLIGLGLGGSRNNEKDPRNDRSNLRASCRPHHREFDALPAVERRQDAETFRWVKK